MRKDTVYVCVVMYQRKDEFLRTIGSKKKIILHTYITKILVGVIIIIIQRRGES